MTGADRLYRLLPAAIRTRDAEMGEPLRALLTLVGEQDDALAADIARGYENLFVETCDEWVVPYLADLVGTTALYDASRSTDDATALRLFPDLRGPRLLAPAAASPRADVAKTVATRRRKGTVSALDDVARRASGYPVRLVEGLARTGWTQHRRHARPDLRTARLPTRLDSALVGTPFDRTTRLVDVRAARGPVGWYHPAHETLAVYRLRANALRAVAARPADEPWRLRLDPLGVDRPLLTRGAREGLLPPELAAAAVPVPLQPALLEADLLAHVAAPLLPTGERPPSTALYAEVDADADAPGASLGCWVDGVFVTPAADEGAPAATYRAQVVSRRLDPWPATRPTGQVVAVDTRNGRVALGDGYPGPGVVTASFFLGVPGYCGGGDYDRSGWLVVPPPGSRRITVGAAGADFADLDAALADWVASTDVRTVVGVLDSRRYAVPAGLDLTGRELVVEAAVGERPVLAPAGVAAELALGGAGSLTVSGVALDGRLTVGADVERVRLFHCELLPGGRRGDDGAPLADGPSVRVAGPAARLQLELAFCVTGTIALDAPIDALVVLDSVVVAAGGTDAVAAAAGAESDVTTERSTYLGDVAARALWASACLFPDRVVAARTQEGCVRYSYVPPDDPAHPERASRTPRRFACQPEQAVTDLLDRHPEVTDQTARDALAAAERARVRPVFVSRAYADPGLAQLDPDCPDPIATGAEDGSEIGAYGHVKQAQRLDGLRRRVAEYLPAGITAGVTVTT